MRDLRYRDRSAAGRELAHALQGYLAKPAPLVLGISRSGVAVAAQVAAALDAELDVLSVGRVALPNSPEHAMGAILSGGLCLRYETMIKEARVSESEFSREREWRERELRRQDRIFRGTRLRPDIMGRTVILVDMGVMTGWSMRAALEAVREAGPTELVVAVPVGECHAIRGLRKLADNVVCLWTPQPFSGVESYYQDSAEVTDAEVRKLLDCGFARPKRVAAEVY